MKKMRIGIVGLGARGIMILKDVLLPMEGYSITAVCDVYPDRLQQADELITAAGEQAPRKFQSYTDMLQSGMLDAVYIATSWQTHSKIAIAAMKAGIAVACEVGGAFTEQECWDMVRTYEQTKTPFMPMENCCYGRMELMLCEMKKAGVFGDIVHCDGQYGHDLREEIVFGKEHRHYRLDHYLHRNCENYPTHELAPIGMLLDLGQGNRMVSLVSTASRAAGLSFYVKEHKEDDDRLRNATFSQGDIVTTTIKCYNGETITLTLDTTLPRYYSRGLSVHGTKALYCEENGSLFLDGTHNQWDNSWKEQWGNMENYYNAYEHPIWRKFLAEGIKGGHDGMDWLIFEAFLEAWRNNAPMPFNVYDVASWMMVSLLSERSILSGSQPQLFPDFTNGAWMTKS